MKYRVFKAKRFRKNLKKMLRRGKDENKLNAVVLMLAQGKVLPPQYKDH
ncbi:MAG: type II toxin-antitoxin system YafQ family toxin, partial [Kiritimatiellae bacterium]|nr:type II toxin-antitoxin system YafQ family toxin [Kiritimatiellia bacterium]